MTEYKKGLRYGERPRRDSARALTVFGPLSAQRSHSELNFRVSRECGHHSLTTRAIHIRVPKRLEKHNDDIKTVYRYRRVASIWASVRGRATSLQTHKRRLVEPAHLQSEALEEDILEEIGNVSITHVDKIYG